MLRFGNRNQGRRADLLTDLAILLGVLAVGAGAHLAYQLYEHQLPVDVVDLDVYRMGGDALLHGLNLYDLKLTGTNLPFTYTPFAAIVFMPLSLLDHDNSVLVWTILNLGVLLRVCFLLAHETRRRVGGEWPSALLAFALFLLALDLEPFMETFGFGQVNIVILWLVLEDMLRRRPHKLSGAAIGLATGIKLVPGLFIVFLLVTRRVREAVTAGLVTLGTILLGFVLRPDQASRYWGGLAFDPTRMGEVFYIANQSVNGAIFRVVQPDGSRPLWLLASVPIVVVCLATARVLWTHDARLLATCTIGLASLLVSPISWSHHWIWFLPIVAALLDPKVAPRLVRLPVIAGIVAMTTTRFTWGSPRGFLWTVPHADGREHFLSTWERFLASTYVWMGLALVALAVAAAFRLVHQERAALDELEQLDQQGVFDEPSPDATEPTDRAGGLEDDDPEVVPV